MHELQNNCMFCPQSEDKIVTAIQRGLEDIEAERTVPHQEAMKRIRETIERVAKSAIAGN